MTNDARQPTLDRSREAPTATDLAALSLVEAAALLALARSTFERAPISPCTGLTEALSVWLEQRGVIELGQDRDLLQVTPALRAVYDPIVWRFRWTVANEPGFAEHVRTRLAELVDAPDSIHMKLVLWQLLANAEVEGYLAHLLRKHGFDPQWAFDARDQSERWQRGLSLAQMRYVAWASVREGAAVYLRSGGDTEVSRDSIAQEMRRRSRWVESRRDAGFSFLPAAATRQSILLTIFLESVAPIGQQYWLACPDLVSLQDHLNHPSARTTFRTN